MRKNLGTMKLHQFESTDGAALAHIRFRQVRYETLECRVAVVRMGAVACKPHLATAAFEGSIAATFTIAAKCLCKQMPPVESDPDTPQLGQLSVRVGASFGRAL